MGICYILSLSLPNSFLINNLHFSYFTLFNHRNVRSHERHKASDVEYQTELFGGDYFVSIPDALENLHLFLLLVWYPSLLGRISLSYFLNVQVLWLNLHQIFKQLFNQILTCNTNLGPSLSQFAANLQILDGVFATLHGFIDVLTHLQISCNYSQISQSQ